MKILIASLMRNEGSTGVQTHIRQMNSSLQAMGVSVDVVHPFSGLFVTSAILVLFRNFVGLFSKEGYVYLYHKLNSLMLRWNLTRYLKENKNESIDIVYAQCPFSANVALRLSTEFSFKVIMVVHFNESQALEWHERWYIRENLFVYKWIDKVFASAVKGLDGLIFVSSFMRDKILLKTTYFDKMKYAVIPNFLSDIHVCSNSEASGDIITVGTLEPRKNQRFLLRLLEQCNRKGFKLNLDIVGVGEDLKELNQEVVNRGLIGQVKFLGYIKNAYKIMENYKLYAHPAMRENLSIALIEALRSGMPIVAMKSGGNPEILFEGENGFFLSSEDLPYSADLIIQLINNKRMRSSFSLRSKEIFEELFSENVVIKKYLKFFDRVNSGR